MSSDTSHNAQRSRSRGQTHGACAPHLCPRLCPFLCPRLCPHFCPRLCPRPLSPPVPPPVSRSLCPRLVARKSLAVPAVPRPEPPLCVLGTHPSVASQGFGALVTLMEHSEDKRGPESIWKVAQASEDSPGHQSRVCHHSQPCQGTRQAKGPRP